MTIALVPCLRRPIIEISLVQQLFPALTVGNFCGAIMLTPTEKVADDEDTYDADVLLLLALCLVCVTGQPWEMLKS